MFAPLKQTNMQQPIIFSNATPPPLIIRILMDSICLNIHFTIYLSFLLPLVQFQRPLNYQLLKPT